MQNCANSFLRGSGSRKARCLIGIGIASILLCGGSPGTRTGAVPDSRGRAAVRSGKYAEARKYFESALNDKANQEENHQGLLQVLRETGDYREAERLSKEYLAKLDNFALLHLERGRILQAIGRYAEAESHWKRSLALSAAGSIAHMEATRALADLLEKTGRRNEARPLWDRLIDEYRAGRAQGSRKLGIAAVAAWRRGYVQDAKDLFMDATDPKLGEVSLEALADFGYLFLDKYNATDALGVFRDCLKINPSYPDALVGMALARKYDSDFEAAAHSAAALEVNPNCVPALNVLAAVELEEENPEAAEKVLKAALAVNPADLESLSLLAVSCYFRGDKAGFAENEKQVLGINSSNGRFYYTLAESLVSRRKYQQAVDFNRQAVSLDPELWAAYASLGMNLTRVGDLEEGRKAIQTAFEGDPYNVWAFNSLDLFDQMDTFVSSRSEHFRFLMSKEDAPVLAPYAADLAEEMYDALTRRYGFEPDGPIQIEIFPDHGGFAVRTLGLPGLGGALGVCFGKVVALDSPRARALESFNWGTTLWHEFAHVMTLQISRHNIPRWFSEGLSVYEEHKARPGWGDRLTGAFLKAYKEGKLLKASQLNSGIVRPQSPQQIVLSYYQAGLACEWMEEAFGFDKIRQSLLLFAEGAPAEAVFRKTLGLDAAGMDAAYARFIDSRVRDIAARLHFPPAAGPAGEKRPDNPDKNMLQQRLRDDPEDFFANLQMGALLQKEGNHKEAEALLKKAQQLFPQYVAPGNPYQLLGHYYLATGRENEALAQFVAWSREDGESTDPLIRAADIYRNRKDWASALRMLNLSIYINPYDAEVQKKLANTAMEAGKWPEAIAAFRVLVALNPSDPAGTRYDLARALMASGNKQEARRQTLRALEIAPTFLKAQELLLKLSGDIRE